jgi:hypothetical protein
VIVAAWLLLVVSLVLVPLLITGIVLDVDSPIALAQKVYVRSAERVLFFSSLFLQVLAASLLLECLQGRLSRIITMLQFLGLFVACSAASFLAGFAIDGLTGNWLIRLAFEILGLVKLR